MPLDELTPEMWPSRCLSSLKDERLSASQVLSGPDAEPFAGNKAEFVEQVFLKYYSAVYFRGLRLYGTIHCDGIKIIYKPFGLN